MTQTTAKKRTKSTHVLDFDGKEPITEVYGKYTHHRGLFIGWKDTIVNGVDFDTWHR